MNQNTAAMDTGAIVIVAVNVILALGCGWPLAVLFSGGAQRHGRRGLTFATLIGVYVVEAAAFSASMGTDLLSIGLAPIWGSVLGVRLRRSQIPPDRQRKIVLISAIYTGLPAGSFIAVPLVAALAGWSVLSVEAGARFGVPGFLPWPLNTILGFCVLVAGVAVVAKVFVTTRVARLAIRRSRIRGEPAVDDRAA